MSRVIKFRAWDKVDNVMINFETLLCAPTVFTKLIAGERERSGVLMQFTGLHDVNGVEIYEGDILRQEVNKHYWLYVVSELDGFGSNLFACEYENNLSIDDELCTYTFNTQKVKLGSKRDFVNSEMKVIGNIHQNPELLESKP